MPPSNNNTSTKIPPACCTLIALTFLCGTLSLTEPQAHAYSVQLTQNTAGTALHWETLPVPFSLHPACAPGLPQSTCLQSLRDSFQAWVGAPCSSLAFVETGEGATTNLTALGGPVNGLNELAWTGEQWPFGQSVLGVASPVFYDSGEIIEADIAFNSANIVWSLSGSFGTADVMSVAVHEIGHLFGLGHVLEGNTLANVPTMAPTIASSLVQRTPEPDELLGTCFLAPAGTFTCGSNDQCPMVVASDGLGEYYLGQSTCESGSCSGSFSYGSSNDGQECSDHSQCSSSLCVDDGIGAFCRQPCWDNYPCASGFFCEPLQGVPFGACLPNEYLEGPNEELPQEEEPPSSETTDLGAPCQANQDCESGICAGQDSEFVCTKPCLDEGDCPIGWSCSPIGAGVALCLPVSEEEVPQEEVPQEEAPEEIEPVSSLADGEPCSSDAQCAGGVCQFSFCTRACHVLDAPSDCDTGMACMRTSQDTGDGLCLPLGKTFAGDPCSDDSDCYTLLCDAGLCRATCDPSGAPTCPFQQGCWPLADFGFCADGVPESERSEDPPSSPSGTEPDEQRQAPERSSEEQEPQPFWPDPNAQKGDQGWGEAPETPSYEGEGDPAGCAGTGRGETPLTLLFLLFVPLVLARRIHLISKGAQS